jgi:hypothetical protein
MVDQISSILKSQEENRKTSNSLFSAILDSSLPPDEITLSRLHQEAITVIGAGVETTMRALCVACFHILDNIAVYQLLRSELEVAIPDPDKMPTWDQLSKLPYLAACVEEGMFLSFEIWGIKRVFFYFLILTDVRATSHLRHIAATSTCLPRGSNQISTVDYSSEHASLYGQL